MASRRRTVCRLLPSLVALLGAALALGCAAEPEERAATPAVAADAPRGAATPDDPSRGKWRRAREAAPAGPGGERAARVRAVPYLQGYRPAEDRPTIGRYDPARAWAGLNLYTSGHAAEAVLMDMEGGVLHRWRHPLRRLWPELYEEEPGVAKLEYWRRAYLYPNGDLLGIYEGLGLVKLDARSNVLWAWRGGAHHDLEVLEGGEIWVLDREGKLIPRIHPTEGVLEDFVTVLGPGGRVRRRISLLAAFERSPFASMLEGLKPFGDIFHTNTLEVLDGRFADLDPAFRRGNVLLSILEMDALAVLDPETEAIVWAKKGSWRRQHQPTFLDDGRLLLFDNRGAAAPDRSRVIEIDPAGGEVAWRYGGSPEVDFFSKTLGSAQRLPNGNTLITESENGRALEVTRQGEVVWELYNPHRAGEEGELVAVLFEVVRLPPDFPFRGLSGGQRLESP
jgi:hypothetical protein